MKMYQLVMLACASTWSLGAQAQAQWQWLDKDGRKVFSDLAPPPDIPQKNILKQPGEQRIPVRGTPASQPAPAQETAPLPSAAASPRVAAGTDKDLQQRKAQMQAAANSQEAARKKLEDAKHAALRADNCSRAQSAKDTYESGRPLRQTNAQGELVVMDEAARAAELRRAQAIIASDCNARP